MPVSFSEKKLVKLLYSVDKDRESLYKKAVCVREEFFGKEVYLRGVVEISNYCDLNCLYCGMRKDNKELQRYRLSGVQVLQIAKAIESYGIKSIMLQSGDDYSFPISSLTDIISLVKKETSLHIMLCLGERKRSDLEKMREAGANMYILKLETMNPTLYTSMRPNKTFEQRLDLLLYLKELGYEVSSGFIVGLPEQNIDELVEGVGFLKEIGVQAASVSPFIPNDSSPLSKEPFGDLMLTYNMIAILRLALGNIYIPSVSSLSIVDHQGQLKGIQAGANVITINFTPESFRNNYLIYNSHRSIVTLEKAAQLIRNTGLNSSLRF